jgi:hypothetical protein
MALNWFESSRKESIQGLIAKRSYGKAIEQIKAALQRRRDNQRLRVQLADVLVLAGRKQEAMELLHAMADEYALAGMAAKAISMLKRIHKLQPGVPEVTEKLAYLIRQQQNPSPNPWRSSSSQGPREVEIGMEGPEPEIGMEVIEPSSGPEGATEGQEIPAARPVEPPPKTAVPVEAPPQTAVPAEPAPQAAVPGELGSSVAPPPDQVDFLDPSLHDELVALVEATFKPMAETIEEEAPPRIGLDTPLFRDFSQEELVALIGGLELVTAEPGEILMSAGEPGDSLYVLTTGLVRAYTRTQEGRHVQARLMTDGDFFGEISVLTGNPRTATITAVTPCDLLKLDRPTLDAIVGSHPRVREVLQDFYSQRASQAKT